MYNGYLMKINNTVFPEKYIADKSFQVIPKPIVINDYYDADYKRHIIYAPEKEVTIEFSLAKMLESDLLDAQGMLSDSDMTIEYYNARTGLYEKGLFTSKDSMVPKITKVVNGYVIFGAHTIRLIRKQVVQ